MHDRGNRERQLRHVDRLSADLVPHQPSAPAVQVSRHRSEGAHLRARLRPRAPFTSAAGSRPCRRDRARAIRPGLGTNRRLAPARAGRAIRRTAARPPRGRMSPSDQGRRGVGIAENSTVAAPVADERPAAASAVGDNDARMAILPTTRDRVGGDVFALLRHRVLVGDAISGVRASYTRSHPAVSGTKAHAA